MYRYEGNKFALACCECIIKNRFASTTVYFYGPHSCGKTALLSHIENELFRKSPATNVMHLAPAEINRSLSYTQRGDLLELCKDVDVLLIDDIQYIDGYWTAESILLDLIKSFECKNGRIILTGDRPIEQFYNKQLDIFYKRLGWNMSAKISMPDRRDCFGALTETAKGAGMKMNSELICIFNMILDAEGDNIGRALSTFRRIVVRAQLLGIKVSKSFAENIIYDGTDIELLGA